MILIGRNERNVLFNNTLNTFYLCYMASEEALYYFLNQSQKFIYKKTFHWLIGTTVAQMNLLLSQQDFNHYKNTIARILYFTTYLTHFLKFLKEARKFFCNDALNTFYLWLYGIGHMVKDHSDREETDYQHYMGYSFKLAVRALLYASSHREDSMYHLLH